jgi:hypothetical protein
MYLPLNAPTTFIKEKHTIVVLSLLGGHYIRAWEPNHLTSLLTSHYLCQRAMRGVYWRLFVLFSV